MGKDMNLHAEHTACNQLLHTQHLPLYDEPTTCFGTASSGKWLFIADSAIVGSNTV
jgi:hypothetical protein